MLRTLGLLAIAACAREVDPTDAPHPAVRPPRAAPPARTVDGGPRTIQFRRGGLGVWRGQTCGCQWSVEIDVATRALTAMDPDGKPWTRTLDAGELRDLLALADTARHEPDVDRGPGMDFGESLDIWDGTAMFEVATNGPIRRPAAAALVRALDAAARWPRVR
jgi:hypothetical protein